MKFLIAGYGSIGRRHFHNLLTLGEEDILFFRTNKSSLDDDELAGYVVETDLNKALAHNPDAVIVSNPTAFHLDVAIPAAEAGCHILLEKPVSHNMDRIATLKKMVKEKDSQVLVGFQFRFHPSLRKISRLLGEGRVGDVLSLRSHWGEYLPDWHPWEDYRRGYSARKDLGGGVILTLSHPFDYLRWLVGEIEGVWGLTGSASSLDVDVEDTAEVGLRFANHVIGSVHLNYTQRPPSHKLEIVGSRGTIRWDYHSGDVRVFETDRGAWEIYQNPADFVRNELFLSEMEHFLDIIRGKASPVCSLDDGIRVQEIVEGVKYSARTGNFVQLL